MPAASRTRSAHYARASALPDHRLIPDGVVNERVSWPPVTLGRRVVLHRAGVDRPSENTVEIGDREAEGGTVTEVRLSLFANAEVEEERVRVSAHRRRPHRSGEFAAQASTAPAIACETLYAFAECAALTWRCVWKLALHASTMTESCCALSSSMPRMWM